MKFTRYFSKFFKTQYQKFFLASGLSISCQFNSESYFSQSKNLEFTVQYDNSIYLESNNVPDDFQEFKQQLDKTLNEVNKQGRKCAWLKLDSEHFKYLEYLMKEKGFKIHHALKGYIMLTKWLDESQEEFYVPYATHNAGSGGVVINEQNEILLVKEKKGMRNKIWSFPGGRVDLGEAMHEASVREVREETGLVCEPKDLLLLRDSTKGIYSRPDIYFLYILKPLTNNLQICQDELADYKWVPLKDLQTFLQQQELVVPLQRLAFEKLFQLYNEGYKFNNEKRVQEIYTYHNNSNYNIYIPIRGHL